MLPAPNIKLPTLIQTTAQINSKKASYPVSVHNKENCSSNERKTIKQENISTMGNTGGTKLQPIVVNINTETISKSFLEETADSLLKLSPQKQCNVNSNSKDDSCIQKERNIYDISKQLSHTLPNRNRKRSSSLEMNEPSTGSMMKNNLKSHHEQTTRQSHSVNSSPYKRSCSPEIDGRRRSCSLDRALLTEISQKMDTDQEICRSNETVSSTATVDNFERQLVSKIAERFAVEEEFRLKKTSEAHAQDYYIDDELDAIGADLTDSNFENPIQSSFESSDQNQLKHTNVINCNVCIGECVCFHGDCLNITSRHEYDSAEDTDERTDRQLR